MNTAPQISADGSRLAIHVPLTIRKRGGRKLVFAPAGTELEWPQACKSCSLVNAIVRANRWQRLLEAGNYSSMRDLAAAERISPTYVSRLLRLTLLAPTVVEAILDGRLQGERSEQWLLDLTSRTWEEQECQARP